MNQLYRIKPLEWRIDHDGRLGAGSYKISVSGSYYWGWSISSDWTSLLEDTEDEAKAACEAHRRKLLEAELEPAYQPSTELPTEPGLYWCLMNGFRSMWLVTDDGEDAIGFTCLLGSLPDDCKMTDAVNHGKWIRIPEPEVER